MKNKTSHNLCLLSIAFVLGGCSQQGSTRADATMADSAVAADFSMVRKSGPTAPAERLRTSYKHVSEIVADGAFSAWVHLKDSTTSLALHFQDEYIDTLAVSYSSECWFKFPCKVSEDKIIVYWDTLIDTKYNFDIVKAMHKADGNYVGKPFMILELANDTTLKATYPMQKLIKSINSATKEAIIFFPDQFEIAQEGYL